MLVLILSTGSLLDQMNCIKENGGGIVMPYNKN